MRGNKTYGRAFPIREADIGAYRMTPRPRGGYRPNPMGVTTLSTVNGPGAYARAHGSARSATNGLSRAERLARARRLMENRSGSMQSNTVHRAAFVQRMRENPTRMGSSLAKRRAGKRLAAFNAARKRGLSKTAASRSAARSVGVRGQKKTRKARGRRAMRRNYPRGQTQAERARYEASPLWEKTGKGKGKKSGNGSTTAASMAQWEAAQAARIERLESEPGPVAGPATNKQAAFLASGNFTKAAEKLTPAEMKRVQEAKKRASEGKKLTKPQKKAVSKAMRASKDKAARKTISAEERAKRDAASKKHRRAKFPRQYGSAKVAKSMRTHYGPFRRASVYNARTGRRELSFMYRDKQKRLRKIPEWAIAGAVSGRDYRTGEGKGKARTYKYASEYSKARDRILARRKAAAKRAESGRDAFTPNAGAKKPMAKRTKAQRSASAKKAARTKKRNKAAGKRPKAKAGKARKKPKAKAKGKGRNRKGSKKGKSRVGRKKATTLKKGLYLVANRRRRRSRRSRRHLVANRRPRRAHARRHLAANRRKYGRRHHRRSYRRNAFVADLASVAKLGALVLAGFYIHRSLTGALVHALTSTDATTGTVKFAGMDMVDKDAKPTFLAQWRKPVTGLVVAAVGITAVSMVKQVKVETRMAVGAGMMTSLFQTIITTALTVSGSEGSLKTLSYLEGYQSSMAASLRGTGRYRPRHLRGLGVARNAGSIMPQFVPIGAVGPQFTQAASGMGEFFTPQSGMGEYFAGPGTQGVGFYEKAGPLALQPGRSHMGQLPVDDGIRPDSNLDHVLDLAESAAGLGQQATQAAAGIPSWRSAQAGMGRARGVRGMGEFFTASPSGDGFAENSVPTQSQWIPNGPLWAGSTPAEAHYTESELPAGILQGPGGNGVLSG